MRIHIAGIENVPDMLKEAQPPYVLFSFAACTSDKKTEKIVSAVKQDYCKSFLVDSGAFTWRKNKKSLTAKEWDRYIDRYIDFINQYDIDHFFEMDVDTVLGLGKVEEYRKLIEKKTRKQTIPVWHTNRSWDYFVNMCKEYPYVSLGGIVEVYGSKKYRNVFPYFIETAHKYGAKLHGLGYTGLQELNKYNFDSVDSTTWLAGAKFGEAFRVEGRVLKRIKIPNNDLSKQIDGGKLNLINLKTWAAYARLMDT